MLSESDFDQARCVLRLMVCASNLSAICGELSHRSKKNEEGTLLPTKDVGIHNPKRTETKQIREVINRKYA